MQVRNIKISVKVELTPLDTVIKQLQLINLSYNTYPSYISFHDKYNYIFFQASKNQTNHVNITRLKSEDDISTAISKLEHIIGKTVISHTIDNITATYSLNQSLTLEDIIHKFKNVKYNAERFPGMFIKCSEGGSAIIFHSGKIVLLGCKTTKEIWNVINYVLLRV